MRFRIPAAGLPLWLLLLCAVIATPIRAATAEELSEVTRLHRAGQSGAALERADRVLSAQPKDAQMRFLKSVVLVDTGRSAESLPVTVATRHDASEVAWLTKNSGGSVRLSSGVRVPVARSSRMIWRMKSR